MKEIRTIVEAYNSIDFSKTKAALVTVVDLKGSSYRRKGARMLVLDNGTYLGGISGGCLEGDALKRATMAILKDKPSIVTYDTTQDDDHQIGVGLGCNGIIDVLFVPLDDRNDQNPVKILKSILNTREPRILITITKNNDVLLGKTLLFTNDQNLKSVFINDQLSEEITSDIKVVQGNLVSLTKSYTSNDIEVTLFFEVILPEIRLIIFGSNQDIYSICSIAHNLGWEIILVTNLLKINKNIRDITMTILNIKDYTLPEIDQFTAIVLMTHDYNTDLSNLPKVLKTNASYIGILGPKVRAERLFKDLALDMGENNLNDPERVFAPTGLDIGATTPEEIALSIIAEIKANFAKRKGGFLKFRKGTIN